MGGGAQKPLLFRSFPYERFPEVDSLHQGCTNLHSVGEGIIAEIHKVIPILIAVNPFGIIDPLDTVIKGMDLFSRKKKPHTNCLYSQVSIQSQEFLRPSEPCMLTSLLNRNTVLPTEYKISYNTSPNKFTEQLLYLSNTFCFKPPFTEYP